MLWAEHDIDVVLTCSINEVSIEVTVDDKRAILFAIYISPPFGMIRRGEMQENGLGGINVDFVLGGIDSFMENIHFSGPDGSRDDVRQSRVVLSVV